jgi:hypothetical protein
LALSVILLEFADTFRTAYLDMRVVGRAADFSCEFGPLHLPLSSGGSAATIEESSAWKFQQDYRQHQDVEPDA